MKYRKVAECPEELEELLTAVNSLPQDLGKFENDLKKLGRNYRIEDDEKYSVELRWLITPECVIELDKILDRFRIRGFLNERFQLYKLINEKQTFLTIIRAFAIHSEIYYQTGTINKHINSPQTFNFDKAIAAFNFAADSTIELTSFRVIEILTKYKIPVERLNICPICRKIYWVARIGKKREESNTCPEKRCSNNFHQRKRRIREYKVRFRAEEKKLEKLKSYNLKSGSDNNLILEQTERLLKLQNKIKQEVWKNIVFF